MPLGGRRLSRVSDLGGRGVHRTGSAAPRARVAAAVELLILAFVVALLAAPAIEATGVPKPSLAAALAGTQSGDRIEYTISLENRGGIIAVDIRMDSTLPAGLTVGAGGSQLAVGDSASTWHAELADLAVGETTQFRFVALIDPAVTEGSAFLVTVDVAYRAPGGTDDYFTAASFQTVVSARGGLTLFILVAGVAGSALAFLGYAWRVRAQGVRIDQLFLLHDSGMMIRHYTNGNGLQKDGDIMSGMLIILQEFVRDSFNDPRGSLEEVRFGDRRVLMARGEHSILAAVVSGRRLNGLPGKLEHAVAEFERAHGAALAVWDGNLARLDAADAAFQSVLTPRYRTPAAA